MTAPDVLHWPRAALCVHCRADEVTAARLDFCQWCYFLVKTGREWTPDLPRDLDEAIEAASRTVCRTTGTPRLPHPRQEAGGAEA